MTFDEWFSAEYHDEVGSVGEDGLRDLLREAWHAALATRPEERRAEVRLNEDETLDEVVTKDGDQLEQMDYNHWFLQIADVAVWLHAKGKITASYEHRTGCAQYETCPHGYSTRRACGACGQPTAAVLRSEEKK